MATSCSTTIESIEACLDTAFQALKQGRVHFAHLVTERDEALRAMRAAQKEEIGWKAEAGSSKTALDQVEMKLQHQENTIAQLRRECTQWKDQSRNWQEHFLRVEQERCRLTLRLEELVAENQSMHAQQMVPFTPKARYPEPTEPQTSSSTTKRISSSNESVDSVPPNKRPRVAKTPSTPFPPHETTSRPKRPPMPRPPTPREKRAATPRDARATDARPSRSEPRQTVIRRVQAVIDVPVKEEEDEEELLFAPKAVSVPTTVRAPARRANVVESRTRSVHGRKSTVGRQKVGGYGDSEVSQDSDDEDEEEDDELRMGTEDNIKEMYGVSARDTFTKYTAPSKARKKSGHVPDAKVRGGV